jgi:hypothetical protein
MVSIPETKPSWAMRCALEISMPWGFMLSAVDAREEADRNDFVVKAGLVAALRAFLANMVVVKVEVVRGRVRGSSVGGVAQQQLLLESSASRPSHHRTVRPPNSAQLID